MFLKSNLGQRLCRAEQVWRETIFSANVSIKKIFVEAINNEDKIFVQGKFDCLFYENDQLILIDYKTDLKNESHEIINKYQIQLNLYQEAIEQILKIKVTEKYLYFFRLGKSMQF